MPSSTTSSLLLTESRISDVAIDPSTGKGVLYAEITRKMALAIRRAAVRRPLLTRAA
jgi:hypothetical protein